MINLFRLKNRQAVRGELSQFVDDMVVTEHMINTILEVIIDLIFYTYIGNSVNYFQSISALIGNKPYIVDSELTKISHFLRDYSFY